MHKLLNLMLLVTLIVTACFVTGCGNTDDDWKTSNPISDDPVLAFTFGVDQSGSLPADARAAIYCPPYITVDGVIFNQKPDTTGSKVTYYTGNLQKANINRIVSAGFAKLVFDQTSYEISSEFFRQAYYGAVVNAQPTATLIVVPGFSVKSAEANGKEVAKPTVTPVTDTKVTMELKLNEEPESVVLTVPQELGIVSAFTNWAIVIDDLTDRKSKSFARGEYDKYYGEILGNGNSLILILTPEGKQLFTKGHCYRGELISLEVQFKDGNKKYLDVSQCIADNIIWDK